MASLMLPFLLLSSGVAASQKTNYSKADQPSSVPAEQCGGTHLDNIVFQNRHTCPVPWNKRTTSDPSSWAPWTHRPYCTNKKYCVFTNSMFRRNRGISIITTAESLADTPTLLDILFNTAPNREPYPAPYKILEIPGKGIGVIAARKIAKHEIIMTDTVSVMADFDLPKKLEHKEGVGLFNRAMEQLPEPELMLTLARSSKNLSAPVAEDVMRTNSFGLPLNNIDRMAVFPKISRINHACDPNASIRWSDKLLENAIVALRDIPADEEINISYSEFGMTYAERQSQLLGRWGFQCTCSMCTASQKKIEESDLRREKLRDLRDEVLGFINKKQYRHAIKGHRELLKVSQEEGLVSQIGEHYWVLARLFSAAGDRINAKKYAKLAYTELKRYQESGSEMDETIKDLEMFMGTNSWA